MTWWGPPWSPIIDAVHFAFADPPGSKTTVDAIWVDARIPSETEFRGEEEGFHGWRERELKREGIGVGGAFCRFDGEGIFSAYAWSTSLFSVFLNLRFIFMVYFWLFCVWDLGNLPKFVLSSPKMTSTYQNLGATHPPLPWWATPRQHVATGSSVFFFFTACHCRK